MSARGLTVVGPAEGKEPKSASPAIMPRQLLADADEARLILFGPRGSKRSFYALAARGVLPSVRVGRRVWFRISDLEEFARKGGAK